MDVSIFLAQAFGLFFTFAGLSMLARPRAVDELTKQLLRKEVVYLSGFLALLIGIPLVLLHNVWDGSWRVIITLIAWLTFLKGVVRLVMPGTAASWIGALAANRLLMQLLVWTMTLLGLYLLYIGFTITAQ